MIAEILRAIVHILNFYFRVHNEVVQHHFGPEPAVNIGTLFVIGTITWLIPASVIYFIVPLLIETTPLVRMTITGLVCCCVLKSPAKLMSYIRTPKYTVPLVYHRMPNANSMIIPNKNAEGKMPDLPDFIKQLKAEKVEVKPLVDGENKKMENALMNVSFSGNNVSFSGNRKLQKNFDFSFKRVKTLNEFEQVKSLSKEAYFLVIKKDPSPNKYQHRISSAAIFDIGNNSSIIEQRFFIPIPTEFGVNLNESDEIITEQNKLQLKYGGFDDFWIHEVNVKSHSDIFITSDDFDHLLLKKSHILSNRNVGFNFYVIDDALITHDDNFKFLSPINIKTEDLCVGYAADSFTGHYLEAFVSAFHKANAIRKILKI